MKTKTLLKNGNIIYENGRLEKNLNIFISGGKIEKISNDWGD